MPEVPGQVDPADAMETILDEQEEDLYRWWALVDSGLQGGAFMFIRLYVAYVFWNFRMCHAMHGRQGRVCQECVGSNFLIPLLDFRTAWQNSAGDRTSHPAISARGASLYCTG